MSTGTTPAKDRDQVEHDPPGRSRRPVLRRWPTVLAAGLAVANLGGGESDDAVQALADVLLLLPLLYLIVAAMRRRRASWPVLVVLVAAMIALWAVDVVAPSAVVVAVALLVLVVGAVRGQLASGTFRLQAWGMLGFGVVALAGLAVDPDLGRYVVAAGWFGHGIWDLVHLRADKVVSRSYAEWCAVVDVLIAIELAFKL